MKKRLRLALIITLACTLLCSCTSGVPVRENAPEITLPPATASMVAPIGDAALEYTAPAVLYLPRHDSARLTAVNAEVAMSASRPNAESLVRALLAHAGDGVASPIGGGTRLSLYGANPVEQSRDVVTVNLAASALQLDRQTFFTACQAIANTLTELSDVNYVNFLVVDKPVALDIANTLPMGALSRSVGQDVGAMYEQLLSRRVEPTENAADKSLSANVTLYFPLSSTHGVMSEVRTCSFASQALPDMVVTILRELARGPQQEIAAPALPLLADLLTDAPTITNTEAVGGQVIDLQFAYNFDDMLQAYGLTRARCMASLTYTLCSYFPNVAGVRVQIGEAGIDALMLNATFDSAVSFTNGVMLRSDFSTLLYDDCTLFFASEDGVLTATHRPVPFTRARNPRALLSELSAGPQAQDSVSGLLPVMPESAIADADILGLAISGSQMAVNFSPTFLAAGEEIDAQADRLLAYALVNTLCCDDRIQSVTFFVSGAQIDGFSGEIYWAGSFYPMR